MTTTNENSKRRLFYCGLASGIVQAIVFNPWDRALYLSVKNHRPFLSRENFSKPMAGAVQTLFQRSASAGLYFPLEDIFTITLNQMHLNISHPLLNFIAGTCAGAVNGFILNPASRVKYHYWGKVECSQTTFFPTAREMLRVGGIKPFFAGTAATMLRDLIFGGVYASMRHYYSDKNYSGSYASHGANNSRVLITNLISACLATIFSSPLNYVRNIHYSSEVHTHAGSSYAILRDLWKNMLKIDTEANYKSSNYGIIQTRARVFLNRAHFLQQRLRIGWGTARVGVGMTFGWYVYAYLADNMPL